MPSVQEPVRIFASRSPEAPVALESVSLSSATNREHS